MCKHIKKTISYKVTSPVYLASNDMHPTLTCLLCCYTNKIMNSDKYEVLTRLILQH